eukprot:11189563-Lingulodinium_polyedra.AAC.1
MPAPGDHAAPWRALALGHAAPRPRPLPPPLGTRGTPNPPLQHPANAPLPNDRNRNGGLPPPWRNPG